MRTAGIVDFLVRQARFVENRKAVLSLLERNPSARLLDLGCADGEFTIELAAKIGAKSLYGIDVSDQSIARARTKGVDGIKADLNRPLPFEDATFDVIHASHVIEHLCDTDLFLREVHRLLETNGYFVISTCNLAAMHNILFLLLGKQPPAAHVSDEFDLLQQTPAAPPPTTGPRHRRVFTLDGLERLLEHLGFDIEKEIGSGFYPLPAPLCRLVCLVDRRHSAYITLKARKGRSVELNTATAIP
jgi:SAM-dependent methyltransferase